MSSLNRAGRSKGDDGFVLVEIAIALFVLALLIGSVVPLMRGQAAVARATATERRLEAVMAVLAAELARHGHLPCPAPANDAGGGIAMSTCTAAAIGRVPAASLGLPGDAVVDGWRRPFTYAVDARATTTDSLATWCAEAGGFDALSLAGGSPAHPVVVLVAHGPGGGAWLADGDRAPGATDGAEVENADDDGDFAIAPFVASGGDRFDDRVLAYGQPAFTGVHGIICPPS